MMQANVQFSDAEMKMMEDAELILTKNKVLMKIKELFGQLQEEMIALRTGENIFDYPPKISRGENYEGLPWLVLDFPRVFKAQNIYAIRTMFWWGNFFSSTLHVSGERKLLLSGRLAEAYERLSAEGYHININKDQWLHHFNEDNYIPVSSISREMFEDHVNRYEHVKLAGKLPLGNIDAALNELLSSWKFFLEISGY